MCLLLRMNQRRSDSFWMLKARRTASVWLVNLSLYQTADQMVFLLCLLSCHCCSNLSAQIRYASNKMHRFQWLLFFSYHCGVTKGRIITRRQHMKPYTLSSQSSLMHSSGRLNINMAIATKQRSLHTLRHKSSK